MRNDEFTEDQKRLMQMLNDPPPNNEEYKKEMAAYQDLREEFKKYGIFLIFPAVLAFSKVYRLVSWQKNRLKNLKGREIINEKT